MTTNRMHVLASGAVVHEWNPPAGIDTRGIVVLQHGFGEHAQRFVSLHHALIGHLLQAGLEVHALDMWGHGMSPGRRGQTHVGRAIRDHQDVVAQASDRGLPLLAVGHSLGGLVTAASIATNPHSVVGVVLMGPALPDPLPKPLRRALGLAARVAPAVPIPEKPRPLDELGRAPGLVEATTSDPLMHVGQVSLLLAATALDAAQNLRASAESWSVPLLVLHGTSDTYTDPAGSAQLVEAIGPVAQLELVQDGYHELLEDLDREAVLARVIGFLNGHL